MECLSHPDRGPAAQCRGRNRDYKIDRPVPLELRSLTAPVVADFQPLTDRFTAAATPTNADLGTVTVARDTTAAAVDTMAANHVGLRTDTDLIVRRRHRHDRGRARRRIRQRRLRDSRGAGDNSPRPSTVRASSTALIPRPARLAFSSTSNGAKPDRPQQYDPGTPAANGLLTSTGLVNWYSITFDSEGVFSGTPAMFVSSVSRSDPNKNIILRSRPMAHSWACSPR